MSVLAKLTQGERIVLVAGILLIVDLVLVPWHSVDLGPVEIEFDTTRTGVEAPNPGYGVAAVILAAMMVTQIVVSKLMSVRLPAPGLPWSQVHLVVGVFVAVVLVIKLARETEFLGFGAYSAILAGILVAYGGWTISQEPQAAD